MNSSPETRLAWLLLPALALAISGCAGVGDNTSASASASVPVAAASDASGSFTGRVSRFLWGPPPAPGQGPVQNEDPDCPPLDVRMGASTVTIYGSGEQAATNVRYQATVGQLARECAVRTGTMTLKVGMQGRILLGPVGGPGRLDLPVRFAVVQEGPTPKTIWTKLYRVPVDIPAGQTHVAFTHIEENISFPNPTSDELEAFVIYVGFDQTGAKEERRPRAKKRAQAAH